MKLFVTILLLAVTISYTKCDDSTDAPHACMIQRLKEKGFLDSDFPYPQQPSRCFLVGTIVSSMEDGFYERFDNKEGINADCVKEELKKNNFIEYALKKEVIEMSKKLQKEEITTMLNQNKEDMKNVLNNAAENCDSDPQWGGVFDEILGIENTTQPVLEQNYCFLKTSIDKHLITIENININPHNIDTDSVDCDIIIDNKKAKLKSDLKEKYSEMGLPNQKINCILGKLTASNFLDTAIALETLEKMDIDHSIRARNKNNLSESLRTGITGMFICMF